MNCIYLTGRQFRMCNAVEGPLVLSLDELSERCMSDQYHICKIYQRYHAQGMKIPLTEYQRGMLVNKF